ncbi:multidrug transporter [Candidatus Acidianus copahuensis]|uniref:Multidrug transporter n=2 Tax=Acidianus TaxID=12914 RepID=A0A031LKU6_9CREN|nr:MFS transporter [Candidatus Acidianus copahuensis]EZQ04692.1 multidrug transporter [Candidatus Acidianus copahuensis]
MEKSKLSFIQALLVIVPMTFSVRASNNMLSTTIPLLSKYSFGFNQTEVGIISAIMALGTFLSSGVINSKLNIKTRRKLFIASSLSYAVILPLFYLSNDITIWAISGVSGLLLGMIMPNIITSASLLEDRKARERLLAIYTLALSASLVAGPSIETLILEFHPALKDVFLFFTPFGIAVGAISFLIKFPKVEENNHKIKVVSNPGFKSAIINILAYNIPFSVILTFGGIYAVDLLHVNLATVTGLFSLFFTTSLLSRVYLSIKPIQKISTYAFFAVSLTIIGLTLILISPNLLVYSIALIILGFPHGLTYPISIISISRTFSPTERNAANSQFFAVMMLIGIIVPLVSGGVAEYIGLKAMFGSLIPIVLILLIFLKKYIKFVDIQKEENKKIQA